MEVRGSVIVTKLLLSIKRTGLSHLSGPRGTTRQPRRTVREPYNWMEFSIWTCSGAATPSSCFHALWDGCLGCGFVNAVF